MKRDSVVLCLAIFLDMFGFGMLIPSVQLRLSDMGAAGWMIGLVQSSTFVFQTAMSPLWGSLGDRLGRKMVFVACTTLSAASMLMFAFASTIPLIAVSRVLAGLGGANVVAAQAFVTSHHAEQRSVVLARIGAAVSAGLVAGPAAGGIIAKFGGQLWVGLVAFTCSALGVVVVAAFVKPDEVRDQHRQTRMSLWNSPVLRDPKVLRLVLLASVAWFSLSCLEGTFGRLIRVQHGFGEFEFGVLFGFESAIAVVVQTFGIGPVTRGLGERKSLVGAYLIQGLGLALTPLAPGLGALFGTSFLFSLGQSFTNPVLNSRASDLVPEESHGELFGVMQASRSIGFVIGPAVGGHLFDLFPSLPYFVAGIVCIVAAAAVPFAVPKDRPAEPVTSA